ncbi:cytochrome P450 [Leptothoe sp. LEGE 181152]|nr:cytochrome P450 [Leptothoe sp. LEGE 181152]
MIEFNPFLPEFRANPYPFFQQLREQDPVHQTASFTGAWVLTRYADVKAILSDHRVQVDNLPDRLGQKAAYLESGQNFAHLQQTIGAWLFFQNPPDHTHFRNLVSNYFASAAVEQLRTQIQTIVDQLIANVLDQGRMDIMSDLAAPLPTLVISTILDIPSEDQTQLTQWSYTLFRVFDQPISLRGYGRMEEAAQAFKGYFQTLIEQRKKSPGSDLLSQLLRTQTHSNVLSEEDFLGFCVMLFSVGQETTENMIGNSMLALLNHPQQLKQLKQEPTLIKKGVEELLRYDSPVQFLARMATSDLDIGGKTIRAGERIFLALGAANRDPHQFSEPDRLHFLRHQGQPIPFGSGIHYCLGAALARMQGQIAINTMIQKLLHLKLAPEPLKWRKNLVLRGLKSLPVTFEASQST